MKRILLIAAVFLSLSGYSQVTKATLTASGLTCSMCSKAIYEALKNIKTIETIKANISQSSYSIVFKKDAAVSFDELKNAVEDAGFFVAKLQVTLNFNNVEVKNDVHVEADGINFHFLNVPDQVLNGEKTVTLVDKDFQTAKEFKKYTKFTAMKCLESGVMESCCADKGIAGTRIYHVTI